MSVHWGFLSEINHCLTSSFLSWTQLLYVFTNMRGFWRNVVWLNRIDEPFRRERPLEMTRIGPSHPKFQYFWSKIYMQIRRFFSLSKWQICTKRIKRTSSYLATPLLWKPDFISFLISDWSMSVFSGMGGVASTHCGCSLFGGWENDAFTQT